MLETSGLAGGRASAEENESRPQCCGACSLEEMLTVRDITDPLCKVFHGHCVHLPSVLVGSLPDLHHDNGVNVKSITPKTNAIQASEPTCTRRTNPY